MRTKIGYDTMPWNVSVTSSEMRPAGQIATSASVRLIATRIAKHGRLTSSGVPLKSMILCGSPRK